MRISQISAGLVACLLCVEAYALQLGQLSASSRLGEPLNARVELFGALPADTGAIAFELRPDIAAPHDGSERAAIASIRAEFVPDARGYGYVALRSQVPLNEPALTFRLRMRTGAATAVRHYALTLPAPVARVARRVPPPPVSGVPTVPMGTTESFGPVQPGQSLWKIMKQAGLAGGDTRATIARIVADNPHAFVGGDANRLRVGVMLSLPGTAASAAPLDVTPAQPAAATRLPVIAPAPVVPATTPAVTSAMVPDTSTPAQPVGGNPGVVSGTVRDAASAAGGAVAGRRQDSETAARLDALAEKFAAIRARYAEQQRQAAPAATPAEPESPVSAVESAPAVAPAVVPEAGPVAGRPDVRSAAGTEAVQPDAQPRPAAVIAPEPQRATSWTAASIVLAVAGCVLLLMLLVKGVAMARRYLGERRSHIHTTRTDEVLRAEITRKAEKRLEMEEQVRRRVGLQRDMPPKPAPGDTIERAIDGVETANVDAEIDEAENRIAHGFYREAETLLKGVISKTPANHRAKLRLAEIYYLNERHDEFVELAGEIHRLHRSDVGDDNWQRIMRMGKIVAPERPPFSGPQAIEGER